MHLAYAGKPFVYSYNLYYIITTLIIISTSCLFLLLVFVTSWLYITTASAQHPIAQHISYVHVL